MKRRKVRKTRGRRATAPTEQIATAALTASLLPGAIRAAEARA